MKWLFSLLVLVLPACTTIAPPPRLEPASTREPTHAAAALSITGDEL